MAGTGGIAGGTAFPVTEARRRDRLAVFLRREEVGQDAHGAPLWNWHELHRSWVAVEDRGTIAETAEGAEGGASSMRLVAKDTAAARRLTTSDRVKVGGEVLRIAGCGPHAQLAGRFVILAQRTDQDA